MLRLYQSNQLEVLAQQLAQLLSEPVAAPLQKEQIVVQHPGMGRWLSLQIASRLGICANLDFPLPASFLWQLFEKLLPKVPHQDGYQPKSLTWRIHGLLSTQCQRPAYAEVRQYLSQGGELRQFQLAQYLATLFDQYLLYRPDWIQSWQEGDSVISGDQWQADLWQQLVSEDDLHWVTLQQSLFHSVASGELPQEDYPRVSIFGVPTLSPGYLGILQQLSEWMDVHLFLLNPSEAHWAEIVTPEEEARLNLTGTGEELYLDVGHPLLATLGRQGRDFFAAINEMDPGSTELFKIQSDQTLLHQMQNQILALEPPQPGSLPDHSIAMHLCHSPMREVEVLYDQLLAALDELPALRPDEILVMTPEIDRYASLLEAVFSTPGSRPVIPYRISDISMQQTNPIAEALLKILALPGSRYGVNDLLSLLEQPAIRSRFELDEEGFEQITQWIDQAAIRWGRDGANKLDFGLPEEERNTWRAGLRQLMLGYAFPADGEQLWHGIFALDAVEGSSTQWLGGLLAFSDGVFGLDHMLGESASPQQWHARLDDVIEQFFQLDETTEQQLIAVREAIDQMTQEAVAVNFSAPVSLAVVRHRLGEIFKQSLDRGFLGGGVNVCALAPMRSLPFRVIYLLGMNDGVFPRQKNELGFDLMKQEFRSGDRSRRVDDRYLFLETLLSARDRLVISYQGHSQRDNSPMPASVVVEELRDCLTQMVGEAGLAEIIHKHPLQPFSADYFLQQSTLFSFSEEMREAAMRVGRGKAMDRPLIEQPLVAQVDEGVVELDLMIQFFENPQRVFAQERLGLKLDQIERLPEERELFTIESFDRSDLEHQLVDLLLQEYLAEGLFERFDAQGLLPHGNAGKLIFGQMLQQAQTTAGQVRSYQGEWLPEPLEVDIAIDKVRLRGHLRQVNCLGMLAYSTSNLYPNQILKQWIRHLVLNHLQPQGVALETHLLDAKRVGRFKPVEQTEQFLTQLIHAYQKGMNAPLPFYPGTSWRFMEKNPEADREKALQEAEKKWFGNSRNPGDAFKPYNHLLYQGYALNQDAFAETSQTLLQPLLTHLEWD
ncbi:MAG: exodeoxyribonuclease V subunit gamma [Candidatus Thiodiazotropha sp. 6PLUC4]